MPTRSNLVSFPGYPLSSHLSISISNCQLISTHNIEILLIKSRVDSSAS